MLCYNISEATLTSVIKKIDDAIGRLDCEMTDENVCYLNQLAMAQGMLQSIIDNQQKLISQKKWGLGDLFTTKITTKYEYKD